jgi:aminoglycoside 2''-phosphotransferase
MTKSYYLKRITLEFPDIKHRKAVLLDHGWDDVVVILDEKIVFSFPRRVGYIQEKFKKELLLLPKLGPRLPLPIPQFAYVAHNKSFAGYFYIAGEPLRKKMLDKLSPDIQRRIAKDLAVFLRSLHATPLSLARTCGVTHTWTAVEHRTWCVEHLPIIKKKLSITQALKLQNLFDEFTHISFRERNAVTHQDFTSDHILFDTKKNKITGIIDFGEVQVSDPAIDIVRMWEYGESFVDLVLRYYKSDDKNIKIKSREKYLYFCISLLFYGIKKKRRDYWRRGLFVLK